MPRRSSFDTAGTALAVAAANGVGQAALAFFGSASAVVQNHGQIEADATANANATQDDAYAIALANGVGQLAAGFNAAASVYNSGHITASALAHAVASGPNDTALALAGAQGVGQVLFGFSSVNATVLNSGHIKAQAAAFATGPTATAVASAVGVSVNGFTFFGTLNYDVENSGVIRANAFASANGANATSAAFATGIYVASNWVKSGTILNSGSIYASATAANGGIAGAVGIWDPSVANNGLIANDHGLIKAYAQGGYVTAATGILITGPQKDDAVIVDDNQQFAQGPVQLQPVLIPEALTTILNKGGTIWAGYRVEGEDGSLSPIYRGNAINTLVGTESGGDRSAGWQHGSYLR